MFVCIQVYVCMYTCTCVTLRSSFVGSSTQPNSAHRIIQVSSTTTGESQYTHHLSVLSTQRHRQVS